MPPPPPLPILPLLPELQRTLAEHTRVILEAPPGAGKTTRVPLALYTADWLADRRLLMLEPRRLAARQAARFMSQQLGERVGETVGYRVRLDSQVGPHTRIEVVTEGVLTRLLQEDPELRRYGAVLFDEFHERSLHADLGLALCLDVQEALRPDLRLLVMSATLEGLSLTNLLEDAPVLRSEGRSHPVTLRYQPLQRDPRRPAQRHATFDLEAHTLRVIQQTLSQEDGSLLVFLPGSAAIQRLTRRLREALPAGAGIEVAPLYGELNPAQQDAALRPAPADHRKIVLATNIAQTSLTIDGIRVVIDAGLERRLCFDPGSGLSRLRTQRISQAAATQRAGRAGRLEPGVCIRLWSTEEHVRLAQQTPPEMLDADLAPLVMELAHWGTIDPGSLRWLDPPPAAAWAQARALLQDLGVLNEHGRLTDYGRALQKLGVHPRLGHLLLQGRRLGWSVTACSLAALLSERDPLRQEDPGSDIRLRLPYAQPPVPPASHPLPSLPALAQQYLLRLGGEADRSEADPGVLLAYAYPDRLAQRRPGPRPAFLLSNGRGAYLDAEDSLRETPYLVAVELQDADREARIRLAAPLSSSALEEHFADRIEERDHVRWDEDSESVRATRQRHLGACRLSEHPLHPVPTELLCAGLLEAIRRLGLPVLPWDAACQQWQARVCRLRNLEPGEWPAVDDAHLRDTLEQWLLPFLTGMSRLTHLKKLPLLEALQGHLTYAQQRRLAQEAPEYFVLPRGSRVRIDYCAEGGPILAAKLQDLFGVRHTPHIAQGRLPLTLHLLSPARRPVQITQDLAGFWRGSYAEVRKDLRGRYPKHAWPEDPCA